MFLETWVKALSNASIAVGADSLMLEVHPDPPNAAVDPLQAIDFAELSDIHKTLKGIAKVLGRKI